MPATRLKLFISSAQKELETERRAVKTFIENDPLLRRFFSVFLFEDLPASDQQADAVYLTEVDRCAVYLGLFGNDYGFEDSDGLFMFWPVNWTESRQTGHGLRVSVNWT